MTINISLSTESILQAIADLNAYRERLEEGINEAVEIMVNEGAEVAQAAYGDWGVEAVPMAGDGYGEITVIGDMPLIAEFGAGDATLDPSAMFENAPDVDVFRGSYSLLEGTMEYYRTGKWHFGGETFTEVQPRMGLYQAKQYIIENSTEIAKDVLDL